MPREPHFPHLVESHQQAAVLAPTPDDLRPVMEHDLREYRAGVVSKRADGDFSEHVRLLQRHALQRT
jgi:hypothetical protein